ncbi:MAG: hypothetical protein DWQ08_07540 [Proteobacteria bacterium]|nr:MAG: hypothetical protein DWQ08_07540 [Pseudomonadota bacterium]
MSSLGLALVLAAAFCHSTWNFCVKRINGGPELIWLFSLFSAVIYLPLAVYVWITMQIEFGARELAFLIGSATLHLGYFLFLQTGYRKGDLSLVYPTARATGPLLSTALAVALLGETLTPQALTGGLIIVAGVYCLTGGFRKPARSASPSLIYGVCAGALIGSYTVWDAHAVAALAIPPLLLDFASSMTRLVVLTPYAIRRTALVAGHWRNHKTDVLVIATLTPLAYILVLYALTFTPVVYVAPLRETSVLITVLMGTLLLGESGLRRRLWWAAFILAGTVLLATG